MMKRQDSKSPERNNAEPRQHGEAVNHSTNGLARDASGGLINRSSANDYDSWISHTHSQPQPIYSSMPEFVPSYYPSMSPPYLQGVPESGPWSGGADIAYQFSGAAYGTPGLNSPNSPYMESFGMVSANTHHPGHHPNYAFPSFNYFTPTASDYSTWAPSVVSPTAASLDKMKAGKNGNNGPATNSVGGLDYYGREFSGASVTGLLTDGYTPFASMPATHHSMPPPAGIHSNSGYDTFKLEQGMAGLGLHPAPGGEFAPHHGGYGVSPVASFGQSMGNSGGGNAVPAKKSWAHVASMPAKPTPPGSGLKRNPKIPIGNVAKPGELAASNALPNWSYGGPKGGNNLNGARSNWAANAKAGAKTTGTASYHHGTVVATATGGSVHGRDKESTLDGCDEQSNVQNGNAKDADAPPHPVLDKLKAQNEYNPREFNVNTKGARYFVIKSYSEDDIHRSIKYAIWCSTEHGNKRLDNAFKEREGKGPVYLFYSVNGSGHFCGVAQMMSNVDYHKSSGVWAQDKWKGQFNVKWIYVKDVPNAQLRHIRLENNENKPVTNSRDTQEVPPEKGRQVLIIVHKFQHTTSIFDDFVHYEKRQEEEDHRKVGGQSDEEEYDEEVVAEAKA